MATYKQNDTAPAYTVQLTDEDSAPVALTLASSVKMLMRMVGTTTAKINAAASILYAATGIIAYPWSASDLNTVGEFEAEVEVTWVDGTVETFPNDGFNTILVVDDIG